MTRKTAFMASREDTIASCVDGIYFIKPKKLRSAEVTLDFAYADFLKSATLRKLRPNIKFDTRHGVHFRCNSQKQTPLNFTCVNRQWFVVTRRHGNPPP